MKLLLLLIISSYIDDKLLPCHAEEITPTNFSYAETTINVSSPQATTTHSAIQSTEKIGGIEKSPADITAKVISAQETSAEIISSNETTVNPISALGELTLNTPKAGITLTPLRENPVKTISAQTTFLRSSFVLGNQTSLIRIVNSATGTIPTQDTARCSSTGTISKSSIDITSTKINENSTAAPIKFTHVEDISTRESAYQTSITATKAISTQSTIAEIATGSTKIILPARETSPIVTSAYKILTTTETTISTQPTMAEATLGSTKVILSTRESTTSIQKTYTNTSKVILTRHTITPQMVGSSEVIFPTLATTLDITSTQENFSTPIFDAGLIIEHNPASENQTTAVHIKSKQKDTKTVPKFTVMPFTYTRYNWSFSITEPTTREIDYRESIEFGEESFAKFMYRTPVYVDKSLMIKEFLEHDHQVILITRPRHWGKSLNLNMLRKFFEIQVDDQGNVLSQDNQTNRKMFCGGQIKVNELSVKSFQPLKISAVSSAMERQGKHPVVQLHYHFIKDGIFDMVKLIMRYEVIKSYKRHFYLDSYFKANPQLLDESEKSRFERFSKGNLTEEDLVNSLRFLSKLLYKYFNQTVFILIDEYDTPLKDAFLHSSNYSGNLEKVLQFYRDLYTAAFKNNSCLAKGFLTGQLRIANSHLFINLDNVVEYTLLDHQFTEFYGFTEPEVDQLLKHLPETESFHIKSFYKGYKYGGQIMYNPFSIKQCIENNYQLELYWLRSGILFPGPEQASSLDGVVEDVRELLEGGSVQIPIKNEVTLDNLANRKNYFNFILFTGYLSPDAKNPNGTYQLVKPNPESTKFFRMLLGNQIPPSLSGLSNHTSTNHSVLPA